MIKMDKVKSIEELKLFPNATLREKGFFLVKDVLDLIEISPNARNTDCDGACQEEIRKLNDKITRLSEANKQLRAENKQLKMRG